MSDTLNYETDFDKEAWAFFEAFLRDKNTDGERFAGLARYLRYGWCEDAAIAVESFAEHFRNEGTWFDRSSHTRKFLFVAGLLGCCRFLWVESQFFMSLWDGLPGGKIEHELKFLAESCERLRQLKSIQWENEEDDD